MEQNQQPCCSAHPYEARRLFCFICKYFYCQICFDENHDHDDHSASTISLPLEIFKFERYLGAGTTGIFVFKVTDHDDGHFYSLKMIPNINNKWEIELLSAKIQLLAKISHPNIIEYKRSYSNIEEKSFMIIQELADSPLQFEIPYISKTNAFSYFTQIMEALCYLHNIHKIPHENLKTSNIMLKQGVVKLSIIGKFNKINLGNLLKGA